MFIAGSRGLFELRQAFHVPASGELHFTPNGLAAAAALVTIYISLRAEFRGDIADLCCLRFAGSGQLKRVGPIRG